MKKILLTLPVLLVFISSNCEKEYQDFIIENNSDESIVISYGFSSHYKDETYLLVHPEAATTNEYKNYLRRRRVPPHSSKNMGESLGERMINSSHSSDTMYLCFIYQADIETLSLEECQARFPQIIPCEYQLTQQDMINHNWTFSFPPTEDMRDIKMIPPFDEVVENARKR